MKIFTTWTDELSAFKKFFSGHEVELLPENHRGMKFDLLLFPGGDDVHPKRYGGSIPKDSMYKNWINPDRDKWEFSVFEDAISGNILPKKILGICRGMQFLNVALGGTLVYDILSRFGRDHPKCHDVIWQVKNIFSSITTVNSIHHQGIYSIGDSIRPKILCVEPSTQVIEAAMWGNDYLGMQFHPELWGNPYEMRIFSQGILKWIEGQDIITEELPTPSRIPRKAGSPYYLKFNDSTPVPSPWEPKIDLDFVEDEIEDDGEEEEGDE